MKMTIRKLLTTSALAVTLVLTSSTAHAQTCQPGIGPAFAGPHAAQYIQLATVLAPRMGALTTQLAAVVDQATYQTLLNSANATAAAIMPAGSGRVVITLPDGTVVIDTNRADGPGNPQNNTFDNFQAKTINENHNSRVAIFVAQEYPCGAGVESKLSTSTGVNEDYLALRAGPHLDSAGTVRASRAQ
jgi:hypothetical protein